MELNHNNTVKQTLQTAMENEQHLPLSDSDSADSESDNAIIFSSPARFHSASDSDDSTKSPTDEATNPISTTATAHLTSLPSSSISSDSDEARNTNTTTASTAHPTFNTNSSSPLSSSNLDHSSKSETDKAGNTNSTTAHPTSNRNSSSPRSSSNLDHSSKSETDKASNLKTTTATAHPRHSFSPGNSSISSDLDDFTKSGTDKATNTNTIIPATINRDSTKVESPARVAISSDQISLPLDSFTLENNKLSAAPTGSPPEKPPVPEAVMKRFIKEEPLALVKADLFVGEGTQSVKEGFHQKECVKEGGDGGNGNRRRKERPQLSILRKAKRDEMIKKAALGFRIFGFLFCLVSISVMAADRNKGWALDSFERYKEFRYCMSVNVIGFVYSGAQTFDLAYQSATGKNLVQHHLRYMFDFSLDQVVTYLLISASSSAATRIDDWQLNWGKDKFPDMASASVAMSFLAFAALAFSSLISGYVLCNSRSK